LKSPNINTLLIPKVHSASDLHFIADVIKHVRPSDSTTSLPRLLPLIESAKAITNLAEICKATPLVDGLIFAAEDFCHDVSITRTPSLTELLFARSAVVTAARAHDLPSSIDIVCTHFRKEDISILRAESEDGRGMGFTGKQVIHPAQVEVVQEAYSPSWKDIEWALRIMRADERALEMGKGAWALDGKMIDVPVVRRAKSIVARAGECGMDLRALKDKWDGQMPE
jgi:citrate lyase subunit beta-like protein